MFIPQASKHAQGAAPADLLTSQPTPVSSAKPASSFGNMLQQSFKAPERPNNPADARRAETHRGDKASGSSTNKTPSGKREPTEQSSPADGTNAAQAQPDPASTAKAPATQAEATPVAESTTAETAATDPASFAVLSSIIAALSNAVQAEGKPVANAGAPQVGEAPPDADLLADPRRKLVAIAGDDVPPQLQQGESDEADILPPKLLTDGDGSDVAKAKPTIGDVKPLVGPTSSAQTAPLSQTNLASTAPLLTGTQGEMAIGSLNIHGVGGPNRAESQNLQQLPVYTPAGHKAWAEDVGNRLIWMANRSESRAELMLTPPSLGKLGVSIQVSGDQTTAQFVAATPAAREALEQAMPRLRELLQQAGINLGQTDVSTSDQHQAHEGAGRDGRDQAGRGIGALGIVGGEPEGDIPTSWTRGGDGVIDIFA